MTVEIDGLNDVVGTLEDIKKRLDNNRIYQQAIGRIAERSIDTNYAAQGRPRWPERRYDYPHPILRKTGRKRATEIVSALAPWIKQSIGWVLRIKTPKYGRYHQQGVPKGNTANTTGKLPIRKSVKFTEQEKKAMIEALGRIIIYG
jgi:phage gpG-like protein